MIKVIENDQFTVTDRICGTDIGTIVQFMNEDVPVEHHIGPHQIVDATARLKEYVELNEYLSDAPHIMRLKQLLKDNSVVYSTSGDLDETLFVIV